MWSIKQLLFLLLPAVKVRESVAQSMVSFPPQSQRSTRTPAIGDFVLKEKGDSGINLR
jgi:hypothetical protein